MKIALLLVPALALALLSAHFYRDGIWPFTIVFAALILLLALRRAWVPRLLQVALALGCLEWAWTTLVLVQQRIALGRPWGRLLLILCLVNLFTIGAALIFRHQRLRRHFRAD
ncbi:MAG: hypothetical protein ACM3H9_08665 [Rhodospirillaceae bacterium]